MATSSWVKYYPIATLTSPLNGFPTANKRGATFLTSPLRYSPKRNGCVTREYPFSSANWVRFFCVSRLDWLAPAAARYLPHEYSTQWLLYHWLTAAAGNACWICWRLYFLVAHQPNQCAMIPQCATLDYRCFVYMQTNVWNDCYLAGFHWQDSPFWYRKRGEGFICWPGIVRRGRSNIVFTVEQHNGRIPLEMRSDITNKFSINGATLLYGPKLVTETEFHLVQLRSTIYLRRSSHSS